MMFINHYELSISFQKDKAWYILQSRTKVHLNHNLFVIYFNI